VKKLLYVCEADSGGIMEYALRQTAAIAGIGVEVHFLCMGMFPTERLSPRIKFTKIEMSNLPLWCGGKLQTIWRLTWVQFQNSMRVCKIFETGNFDAILFSCYKEYFAPFWVEPLRRLASKGAVIGTIAHDPVRDFVMGPLWWHRWCVRLGYSFVRHVFVHDDTPLDFGGGQPEGIQIHQIPHGPYELEAAKVGRSEMRRRLGFDSKETTEIPENARLSAVGRLAGQDGAGFLNPLTSKSLPVTPALQDVVFLAFGQIRDGKNLDLFLKAMPNLPEHVKLLVVGKGDSSSSKAPQFYQKLADDLGVSHRCRWDIRRIPEQEVGDFFAAADMVILTYSANFRSASGVLSAAVSARRPVLSSSGEGPLKKAVQRYRLGVFVSPDHLDCIVQGARTLINTFGNSRTSSMATPEWKLYECENSWEINANRVASALMIKLFGI